ncbi:MAG: DUF5702 domain-containing protein [Clostridiales bacterium]|nr:DUF5702 domain-containing protein [Clostridiales bacterium]
MKKAQGGISIFLSIAIVATIVLTGLLVDAARIYSAKNQAVRALDIATLAILSDFDSGLKNGYGIFAVNMPAPDTQELRRYAELNLERQSGALLYDYAIEDISLKPEMPLADIGVLESQILEYMKYRAPAALASGVLAMLGSVQSVGGMAGAAKLKMEADKKMAEIGKLQQKLRDYLYGDTGAAGVGSKYAMNYASGGIREQLAEEIALIFEAYADVRAADYESEQRARESAASGADDVEKPDLTDQRELRDKLARALDRLQESETSAYLNANARAVECIEQIKEKSAAIYELYDKIDESMGTAEGAAGAAGAVAGAGGTGGAAAAAGGSAAWAPALEAFSGSMRGSLEEGRAMLLDAESARSKTDMLNKNIEAINEALSGVSRIRGKLLGFSPPESPATQAEIREALMSGAEKYNYGVEYDYQKNSAQVKLPDPREYAMDRLNEYVGGENEGKNGRELKKLSDLGIDIASLPSRNAGGNSSSSSSSSGSGGTGAGAAGIGEGAGWGASAGAAGLEDGGGALGGVNLFSEDSAFSEASMGGFMNIGALLGGGLLGARDSLYVNEWILSVFGNGSKAKYSLLGGGLSHSAFFGAEAEYILIGGEDEAANVAAIKAQIVLMRFALNFLHIYSDAEKLALANQIAAALAGWWSAGALTPVVANLVIAAWSLSESILDAGDLSDGKKLPFIKLPGDWKTNIGLPSEGKAKTPDSQMVSYIDYLRILLLLESREKKLGRVNDLLEINSRFGGGSLKTASLYCGASAGLEISVNYIFMTSAFMPASARAGQGRRRLKASLARSLF